VSSWPGKEGTLLTRRPAFQPTIRVGSISCLHRPPRPGVANDYALARPLRHRRLIRTKNLIERLFLEERPRTKIVPHAFGERPMLKLMYAAIKLSHH
jgi:hypothetical protein